MNSEFNLWLLAVGLALGAGLTWLAIGRIARSDDDLAAEERAAEAEWISATIERWGGYAPAELVAQVLLLHRTHLRGDGTRVAGPEAVGEGEPSSTLVLTPNVLRVAGPEAVGEGEPSSTLVLTPNVLEVAGPEAVGEGEPQEAAEEGPAPASGAEPGERPA